MKIFLVFYIAATAFDDLKSIDITGADFSRAYEEKDISQLILDISYENYILTLVEDFQNGLVANGTEVDMNFPENEYLIFDVDKRAIDSVGFKTLGILQELLDRIYDDFMAQIQPTLVDPSVKKLDQAELRDNIERMVPSHPVLSTCVEMENGDQLQVSSYIDELLLKAMVSNCAHGSQPRKSDYLLAFGDLHCNIRVPKESTNETITVELGPEKCQTHFIHTNSTLGIRNELHLYTASLIGDLIVGVTEDNVTASKAIPVGRDYNIQQKDIAVVLFGDYSDPEEPLKPCSSSDKSVTCYGRLQATSKMYTNNTFLERTDRRNLALGKPVYFSIAPMLKVFGIYYTVGYCSFGADNRNFRFLRENGCLYEPLNSASFSEYVTPTGTEQRFQFHAFMFTGPPFTGLELHCTMTMCIKIGQQDTCPKLQKGECDDDFQNGEK